MTMNSIHSAPDGKSTSLVPELLDQGTKVVDLAADFRLKNPGEYLEYYHAKHEHPELLEKAVYGLPEIHRERFATQACSSSRMHGERRRYRLAPLVKIGIVDEKKL